MNNFIKVNRKILKWEWWSDINTFRLFMYMLLMAWWKEGSYKGKPIPRGSFPSSIAELSSETKLTENEIRTAIKHLKSTGEITSKAYNKFTVFTVKNYDLYQTDNEQNNNQNTDEITDKSQTINKQITSKSQTDNEQLTGTNIDNINNIDTEKEDKNNKECKNERMEDNIPLLFPLQEDDEAENKKANRKKDVTEQKHRYGEYQHVLLTDKQLNKLVKDYGENKTQEAIKYLDEYIQMKGYKAKDHNLVLRKWVFEAVDRENGRRKTGYQNKTAEMLQDSYKMLAEWAEEAEGNNNDTKRIYGDCGGD